MKKFALVGVAGFIAPRHLKAIQETGNELVAAMDKFDSAGILDSYFPRASFFTEFERFDRHLEKLRRQGDKVDYVTICSPNYLHDSHIRFALRHQATAICEKPLVLNPWNVDALAEMEKETGHRVFTILQLRLHPAILNLRKEVQQGAASKKYNVDLTYMTSRGQWYFHSWKGDQSKSGGIATNIGIHFFDMLIYIFGKVMNSSVEYLKQDSAAGLLELERATVRWKLSINFDHLPDSAKAQGKRTYRSLMIEGKEIEFSDGFTDLHTLSYKSILEGNGFSLADVRPSIDLAYQIRNSFNQN